MYKNIIKQLKPTYDLMLEHRGGWSSIINRMLRNDLYNNINSEIVFYDIIEKNFIWMNSVNKNLKWIGIIHCTNNTPPYLNLVNISNLFEYNCIFMKNIHNCLGLITLSPNVYNFVCDELKKVDINVNIYLLKHPIDDEDSIPKFSMDGYLNNDSKHIIQVGQQLRKLTSIYLLKTNLKKLWLTGTKNFNKLNNLFSNELLYLKLNNINITDVEMKYTDTFEEYDDYLSKNIILVDLFDTAANNVVLECIIRATPLLIPKLDGSVYYLGEDYPMYFNNLDEISMLLTDENILKTHNYLKTIKVPTINDFTKSLFNIINKVTI